MKIVITSQGESLDSLVDPRFGRAKNFILLDPETDEFSVHDNTQNLNAAQGAGIQAGQKVAALAPSVVITGHCGPKAFQVLRAAGVNVATGATGTIREAIEVFKKGKLKMAEKADVEGHWV